MKTATITAKTRDEPTRLKDFSVCLFRMILGCAFVPAILVLNSLSRLRLLEPAGTPKVFG